MTLYSHVSGYWNATKTIYDPCPAGWRVPQGGYDGVWAKALGDIQSIPYNSSYKGMNLGKLLGDADTIWYPESYWIMSIFGTLYERSATLWTCSLDEENEPYTLYFPNSGKFDVMTWSFNDSSAHSVRCQKEE